MSSERSRKRRKTSKGSSLLAIGDASAPHAQKSAKEIALEKSLFGSNNFETESISNVEESSGPAFEIDAPLAEGYSSEEDANINFTSNKSQKSSVWNDPSDAQLQISLATDNRLRKLRTSAKDDLVSGEEYEARLRKQFKKIHGTPKWVAEARNLSSEDSSLQDVLGSFGSKRSLGQRALKQGLLKVEKLMDANQDAPANGTIHSLQFHPSSNMLLAGSSDKRIRLFAIDGAENKLIQAVHIPELALSQSQFHPSGKSILMSGHSKPWLYSFDLLSGTISKSGNNLRKLSNNLGPASNGEKQSIKFSPDGSLLALSNKRGHISILKPANNGNCVSAQFVNDLKLNHSVADLAFSSDGSRLAAFGSNSEVYIWDLRNLGSCVARWKDEGGFGGLSSTTDSRSSYLALSSTTGIVNVYDHSKAFEEVESANALKERKALKTIQNLTTAVNTLSFNSDSQLLCIASSEKRDALRMVHLPSLTVFSNWPTASSPLGKVTSTAFSGGSEFLAIGNTQGRINLYLMEHFTKSTRI